MPDALPTAPRCPLDGGAGQPRTAVGSGSNCRRADPKPPTGPQSPLPRGWNPVAMRLATAWRDAQGIYRVGVPRQYPAPSADRQWSSRRLPGLRRPRGHTLSGRELYLPKPGPPIRRGYSMPGCPWLGWWDTVHGHSRSLRNRPGPEPVGVLPPRVAPGSAGARRGTMDPGLIALRHHLKLHHLRLQCSLHRLWASTLAVGGCQPVAGPAGRLRTGSRIGPIDPPAQ